MARKLDKQSTAAPTTKALDDLYTMKDDVELKIAGRTLTIGEYHLWDGMTARAIGAPLIDDLEALAKKEEAAALGIEGYLDLLSKHRDIVRELLVLAVAEKDRDEPFIAGLKGTNADLLLMTWWGVCSGFFWRAIVGRKRDRILAELRRRETQAGPTSSIPSPTPVMVAPATSGGSTASAN